MPDHRYLLDTSILSSLVKQPQGEIAGHIARVGERRVVTSIVVACELRFGAVKRGSAKLTRQVEAVLDAIEILPLEPDVDRHYALIRAALEGKGRPIGANDLLIAAHARTLDAVCVTGNIDEFKRVPGLKLENWLV
jgi:tRNA(fMet)-specific endonuclease VapC